MGLPAKLLGHDEREVLHLRTHPKALIGPTLLLVLLLALLGAGIALIPANLRPWAVWVLAGLVALAAVLWVLLPLLRWLTTTYTITNRRVITRRGILSTTGHDLPLVRVNDVSYERGLLDRMFGCGTLVLQTAAEDPVVLPDVPDVERVHVTMTDLLFGEDRESLRGADA